MASDGTSGHYNIYADAFQGGSMSTAVFTPIFVPAATAISDYNAYNTPDAWDYVKQTASVGVGVIEVAASAASGGLLAPVMGVDGAVRVANGLGKLYGLATQGKVATSKLPSNLLGDIGAVVGGVGSKTQFYMQTSNDVLTAAFFPGETVGEMGTAGVAGDAKKFIGAIGEGKYSAAVMSATEIIDDTGATQEAADKYKELK